MGVSRRVDNNYLRLIDNDIMPNLRHRGILSDPSHRSICIKLVAHALSPKKSGAAREC